MVSSSLPNPQTSSYADRAKKASKSSNSLLELPHIVNEHAATSNVPQSSTSNSNASKPSSLLPGVDITSNSSVTSTRMHSSSTSPKPHVEGPATHDTNGDVTSTAAINTTPVANVWSLRKEQMAQARASSRPLQSLSQNTVSVQTRNSLKNASQEPSNRTVTRSQNGLPSPAESGREDPFIVRPHRPPPSVDDTESWPEVGKASAITIAKGAPQHINGQIEKNEKREKEEESPSDHVATPRKSASIVTYPPFLSLPLNYPPSFLAALMLHHQFGCCEKAKWVPIPAEELQAAADALHVQQASRSQTHSRSHSQYRQHNHSRNPNNHSVGSSQPSQGPSKVPSGRTSANHSQIQSQASSPQSSPRYPTRGRRLPTAQDVPTGGGSGSSSGANPADILIVQPRPLSGHSPHHSIPSYAPPIGYPSMPADGYGPSAPSIGPTYYTPPAHMPVPQPSPTHQQPAYPPSYRPGLGRNGYATQAPPMRQSYSGTPPDPYMYPPYGYYGQPLVYWNGQERAASHSPYAPVEQQPAPPQQMLHQGEEDLPPPTMMVRPPPPQESEAVAGYREVAPVLPQGTNEYSGADEAKERRAKDVVFGSIGVPGASQSPSPSPDLAAPTNLPKEKEQGEQNVELSPSEEEGEKAIKKFSIGVAPGDAGPFRMRSRTRSQARRRVETAPGRLGGEDQEDKEAGAEEGAEGKEVQVIDLTDPETKWEFGTTRQVENHAPGVTPASVPQPNSERAYDIPNTVPVLAPGVAPLNVGMLFGGPSQGLPPQPETQRSLPPAPPPQPHHIPTSPNGLQLQSGTGPYPVHAPPPQPRSIGSVDEWEVKDYGYGFGRASGTGYATSLAREERLMRERERERERARERVREREYTASENGGISMGTGSGRPRRGSYSSYHESRGGFGVNERAGFGHERGGFGERGFGRGRGRGMNGGFGRGYSRGYSRGGFRGHDNNPSHGQRSPPFAVTPPAPTFQSLPQPVPAPLLGDTVYYPPPPASLAYAPQGYDTYQYPPYPPLPAPAAADTHSAPAPPMPKPISELSFPLDPTRYYLLAQLEYYLSPQNMASDLFLRKQMDSGGWISVPLLASFNRVRQLTMDLRLVRHVLSLSTIVEVADGGDYVRMGAAQWRRFVLPDASVSVVEKHANGDSRGEGENENEGENEADVEEEEEEVEFVMGKEGEELQPWVSAS
ncbi:hypothetical protein EW146_g1601 [Bondarzewia mesenterica]|uniref:HTH La-type RNA-binding domain-containing protein n=1 Tax=Bondarzewia mesenterica TaxID=1095465 RepID=A0A4S4M399_9AGAM|nr:hypothetical protein EW146_g1601 [Bondarzewia mesenterica]